MKKRRVGEMAYVGVLTVAIVILLSFYFDGVLYSMTYFLFRQIKKINWRFPHE